MKVLVKITIRHKSQGERFETFLTNNLFVFAVEDDYFLDNEKDYQVVYSINALGKTDSEFVKDLRTVFLDNLESLPAFLLGGDV
jgi:hypothetical protein